MKLKLTASINAVLNQAKINLNKLKNAFPIGMPLVDNETDRKIKSLEKFIKTIES